jgi:tight adherence protein B
MDDVAAVAQRLAVLLRAGVTPASAWRHITVPAGDGSGAPGSEDPVLSAVASRLAAGDAVEASIRDAIGDSPPRVASAWLGLGALWSVAEEAGAPIAESLRTFADTLRSLADVERDLAVALAGPAATARTVLMLPVVGVLLGALLGFDTLRVLATTFFGLSCLGAGALLLVLARAWMRRVLRVARPRNATPGLVAELTAVAMSGGASIDRARSSVRGALALFSVDAGDEDGVVDEVLALSRRAGVPAAELLRSEADLARRRARADGRRAAEEAGAALMLPLGACVLPAFLLVGVAPLLASVISSTLPAL